MKMIAACVLAGLTLAQPALATVYTLSGTGTITSAVIAKDGGFPPAPSGAMRVGDAFTLNMTFDTTKAELGSLYDADPTLNVYFLSGAQTSVSAGSYRSSYGSRFNTSSTLQFWNNRDVAGVTDSQSFSSSNYDFKGPTPFDLGGGLNFEMVSLYAFDWSALARNSDLISELSLSSTVFNSNSMSYSYSTGVTPGSGERPIVLVDIGNVSWNLSVVPEPATWSMMIVGFGAVGYAIRRRQKSTARVILA